jgi:hypothetical protein
LAEHTCDFCLHTWTGRRRRFCPTCLPMVHSDDPEAYQTRYQLLYRGCGLLPGKPAVSSPILPVYGPPAPWPTARMYGPPKPRKPAVRQHKYKPKAPHIFNCARCGTPTRGRDSRGKYCALCRPSIKGNRKQGKPRHYQGQYWLRSRIVRATANADPTTRCWRCGLTLAEHKPHKNGTPAKWTAGHTRDGDPTAPLAPEASTCNFTAGARHGNDLRRGKPAVQPQPVKPGRNWYASR